jgi:peptidoglycan-associated lipoprotein
VAAPAPPLAAPTEFREVAALRSIHFDFDRSDIRPDAARILDTNIDWMKSNPDTLILIEGHCDERGTNEYNLALGDRRARATMEYLAARGVASARFTTISYGEERPVCAEHTERCWAKNRRAHFLTKGR